MAQRHVKSHAMMKKLSASISELLNIQRKNDGTDEHTSNEGSSGLHQAALMGNTQLVKLLLQRIAYPDIQDAKGMTPLHYACFQPSTEVARILLQNAARTDIADYEGSTPMHVACKNGLHDTVSLLFYYRADPMTRNDQGKTPFDVASEYGRTKVVSLYLGFGMSISLLSVPTRARNVSNQRSNHSTTALHLAARNGHVETMNVLLEAGWNVNQLSANGTALHEAATHVQLDVVYLLAQYGIDMSLTNAFGHTALDVVKKNLHKNLIVGKEMRALLKDACNGVYGRATTKYCGLNSDELGFDIGQLIWILDRTDSNRWRGVVFGPKFHTKTGTFPASCVEIVEKRKAFGMHRTVSQRQAKKVAVPTVPEIGTNSLSQAPSMCRQSTSSYGSMDGLTITPSPSHTLCSNGNTMRGVDVEHRIVNGNMSGSRLIQSPAHQALEVVQSPRHRNSTGSNSSQASSGFESMKSVSQPQVNLTTVHTLRGDSPPSRNSIHSSSSGSLGSSLERLDESGYASLVNISELIMNGLPDHEVMAAWLHELHYEEYIPLFTCAGYDLPTLARMSPEDLTAIGITKPGHRKRLTTEIHKLQIPDPWPTTTNGGLSEWLFQIGLSEYTSLFESQGYGEMSKMMKLSWEDFEDIGITKLGHLKKLGLAIRKLKENRGTGSYGVPIAQGSTEVLTLHSTRNMAEVKPYSHLPQHLQMPHSPQHMTTFHQPMIEEYSSGTFPRRSTHHHMQQMQHSVMVTTEAMVHAPQRPTVTVKPRPVAKIVAKTKRHSGEVPGDMVYLDSDHLFREDDLKKVPLSPSPYMVPSPKSPLLCRSDFDDPNGGIRLNLNSPSKLLAKSAPPPPPPKRQMSQNLTVPLSTLVVDAELSPASSVDEFPPPPSPIQCEQSIKHLRSIMDPHDTQVPGSSRSSTSSTEALPFANDNCGTIRARDSHDSANRMVANRPNVMEVFASKAQGQAQTTVNGHAGNNDVLNDIGTMLQNLTDQLDAMLYDPNRAKPTQAHSSSLS